MIRHGKPPYLECSSMGDKRFSALYARVDGKTIEQHYQEAKVFECGTILPWRKRKGLKAANAAHCLALYSQLWDRYIAEHPELLDVLVTASGVSDFYGKKGSACQATELWRIRNSHAPDGHKRGNPA